MTAPPVLADARERERALDPAQSFIVQAPAGSGKTELLIQRYLALLSRVEAPEQVVAITFTRKAAAEMRHRILDALAGAAAGPPGQPHARRAWDLARTVLGQDRARGWSLEEFPNRLQVQTIDSLCASLARRMPLPSGFGAQPEVTEAAGPLYEEAAWRTLAEVETGERWSGSVEALLRHLDNDWGRVAGLLSQMLGRRDQWLRHLRGGRGLDRGDLERAIRGVIVDALEAVRRRLPEASAAALLACARFAASNLQGSGSSVAACAGLTRLPGAAPEDLPVWRGIAELLLTKNKTWRAQVSRAIGFPPSSAGRNAAERQRFADQKEAFRELLAELAAVPGLGEALHALAPLPPPGYDDAQWAVLDALAELLVVCAGHLTVVLQERGAVDFTEVSQRARQALGTPDQPTDLALVLDYRIQHILMDEFQDTSLTQHALLECLTAGWQPGDGRTLFLVGDPMQSIYGFREAEVGLFLQVRSQGIGSLRPAPLRLSVNFRSRPALVEWANDTFARILPAAGDPATGAVPHSPSVSGRTAGAGAAVQVHPLFEGGEEAALAVEQVRTARSDAPDGTVAVLVRSRAHLAELVPALKSAGLRFRAVELESLAGCPVVQDLLALTRALLHPADRAAWLAVLRAPWCGLILADLHALAEQAESATIWERLTDTECLSALSDDGRRRAERLAAALAPALAERGRLPPRQLVEGAWLGLGGPACVRLPSELDEVSVYLDALGGQGGLLSEPTAVDDLLEGLFAPADRDADERLTVMTIHKAKGLEFDTVILPGLGRGTRREQHQLLAWIERPAADPAHGLLLAPIAETGQQAGALYDYVHGLMTGKRRYETARLLYVAATRARERLHLLGQVRLKEDGSLGRPGSDTFLALLWPGVERRFEEAARGRQVSAVADPGPDSRPDPPELRRLAAGWAGVPPPAAVAASAPVEAVGGEPVPFDWAGETARHVGTVVHRYLRRIAVDGVAAWEGDRMAAQASAVRVALARLGVLPGELEAAVERTQAILVNVLRDPRGRWILSPEHTDARGELALSAVVDGRLVHVVIDRTFVDSRGQRWVVDYKTGSHEGSDVDEFIDREVLRYRPQLETYGMLFARRESRPVRLGLYFPQLCGWREWAPGG
jgi:ATP-dependent helicase/nuclease subunit A